MMSEKELEDALHPWVKDFNVLAHLFVTQKQHQEFADKLYTHISDVKNTLVGELEKNRSIFIGETEAINVEIGELKTQNKLLVKGQADLVEKQKAPASISYRRLGGWLVGASVFFVSVVGVIEFYIHYIAGH